MELKVYFLGNLFWGTFLVNFKMRDNNYTKTHKLRLGTIITLTLLTLGIIVVPHLLTLVTRVLLTLAGEIHSL